jgi:hypothetical protein
MKTCGCKSLLKLRSIRSAPAFNLRELSDDFKFTVIEIASYCLALGIKPQGCSTLYSESMKQQGQKI